MICCKTVHVLLCAFLLLLDGATINCPKCYRGAKTQQHTWCSSNAKVQGTCAHVAGTRYFVGLAVMQGKLVGTRLFLGLAMAKVWPLGH